MVAWISGFSFLRQTAIAYQLVGPVRVNGKMSGPDETRVVRSRGNQLENILLVSSRPFPRVLSRRSSAYTNDFLTESPVIHTPQDHRVYSKNMYVLKSKTILLVLCRYVRKKSCDDDGRSERETRISVFFTRVYGLNENRLQYVIYELRTRRFYMREILQSHNISLFDPLRRYITQARFPAKKASRFFERSV